MKRGAALIASTLLLGACGSSSATAPAVPSHGPAVYAQVREHASILDVWRDDKGRITFDAGGRWRYDSSKRVWRDARVWRGGAGVPRPESFWRYDPSRLMLTELFSTSAAVSTRYLSDRAAWRAIDQRFGIPGRALMRALRSGSASPEPVGYHVPAPLTSGGNYMVYFDYGANIARMAKESRFTLPRLASLDGYPLLGSMWDPKGRSEDLDFGSDPGSVSEISLVVSHRRPDAPVAPSGRRLASRHYRAAGIRYAVDGDNVVSFPYHGQWLSVDVGNTNLWAADRSAALVSVIRAIASAPTAG